MTVLIWFGVVVVIRAAALVDATLFVYATSTVICMSLKLVSLSRRDIIWGSTISGIYFWAYGTVGSTCFRFGDC